LSRLSSKQFNDYITEEIYPILTAPRTFGGFGFNDEKTLTYLRKFKNDVLLYIFQKRLLQNSTEKNISVKKIQDKLFSTEGIERIINAKKAPKTKDLRIIKEIQLYQHLTKRGAGASNQSYRFLKMANKRYNVPESDIITESWNELYKIDNQLALNIAMATMLQSGLNSTPISFTDKIPFELYKAMGDIFGEVEVNVLVDHLKRVNYLKKFNENNIKFYDGFSPSIITKYDKDFVNAERSNEPSTKPKDEEVFEVLELSVGTPNKVDIEAIANQFPDVGISFSEATLKVQREKAEKQVKEC
jgi:hypothetical protein